jgi:hypothetical protein
VEKLEGDRQKKEENKRGKLISENVFLCPLILTLWAFTPVLFFFRSVLFGLRHRLVISLAGAVLPQSNGPVSPASSVYHPLRTLLASVAGPLYLAPPHEVLHKKTRFIQAGFFLYSFTTEKGQIRSTETLVSNYL